MDYIFPTSVNPSKTSRYTFSTWKNTMNEYDEVKVQIELPSILSLYKADTTCPTPQIPFADLGYFKDENGKIEVIIQASAIQHEIALEDYYLYFNRTSEATIIDQRLIDDDPDKVDVLSSRKFENGQTWVTRRRGYKTWMGAGAFVITLNFACESSVYDTYADMFLYMMNSFRLINEPSYNMAEQLKLYAKKYPLDFATYIPFSWKEDRGRMDTVTEMRSMFKKKFRGAVSGIMNINARKASGDDQRETLLNDYLMPYIAKGLVIPEIHFLSDQKSFFTTTEECDHDFFIQQDDTKIGMNIKIFLMKRKRRWFYIDMIGFSREQDFEIWAINKRAFNLVVDELETK